MKQLENLKNEPFDYRGLAYDWCIITMISLTIKACYALYLGQTTISLF
jgi:hypothetical protein